MNTNRQHLKTIPASPDAGTSHSETAPRRDVAMAVIVGALLLAGIGAGGSLADRRDPLLTQPAGVSESQPAQEFDYFPSHYVNQGVASPDEIPTF